MSYRQWQWFGQLLLFFCLSKLSHPAITVSCGTGDNEDDLGIICTSREGRTESDNKERKCVMGEFNSIAKPLFHKQEKQKMWVYRGDSAAAEGWIPSWPLSSRVSSSGNVYVPCRKASFRSISFECGKAVFKRDVEAILKKLYQCRHEASRRPCALFGEPYCQQKWMQQIAKAVMQRIALLFLFSLCFNTWEIITCAKAEDSVSRITQQVQIKGER